VKREYADDEAVTESTTTLRIHVGGGSEKLGVATGIHWHMNVANVVEYRADPTRMKIPWIRVTDLTGAVREYVAEGVPQEELDKLEPQRTMDCMDCHNVQATHSPRRRNAPSTLQSRAASCRGLPFMRRRPSLR
jgi:hypothetical protein